MSDSDSSSDASEQVSHQSDDACQHPSMKDKWLQLRLLKKHILLKKITLKVLLQHPNLPELITDNDWKDLIKHSHVSNDYYKPNHYYIMLDMEGLAYRYDAYFWTACRFFRDSFSQTKIGEHLFIQHASMENVNIYLDFNMQAVFHWMSQQDVNELNNFMTNLSI